MASANTGENMKDILKDYIEAQLRELDEEAEVEIDDDLVMIGFDSVAYVRLLAFIRQSFGVRVPDTDVTVEQFGTVSAIVNYLQAHGAEQTLSSEDP